MSITEFPDEAKFFFSDAAKEALKSNAFLVSGSGDNIKYRTAEETLFDTDASPNGTGIRSKILRPTETVIANFQTGHGFGLVGSGTLTADTTIFIKGSQSLKFVSNGAGNFGNIQDTGISPVLDFRGKYLLVSLYVDDNTSLDDIAGLSVYLSSDNFGTNYYLWRLMDKPAMLVPGSWVTVSLSFGAATVLATPDRSAINAIKIRLEDQNSEVITVNVGCISSVVEPNQGIVSITFDDALESQYTEARKKMDEFNIPGTAYIIPDFVGSSGKLSLDHLNALQWLSGWDISGHHQTNLTTLTEAEIIVVLKEVKKYLLTNGFVDGADDFSYPNSAYNDTVILPLVRKFFRSARTTYNYCESIPPPEYHRLRAFSVVNTTPTATITARIDRAIANNEWLILVFHDIVATASTDTQYSIANFGTVIDYVASSGIAAKTLSSVLNFNADYFGNSSVKSNSITVAAAGPSDGIDVAGVNTVFLDTSSNSVTIGAFVGGKKGQVINIVRLDSTNNATLEHNEGTANQNIFLKNEGDQQIATYGGWTLLCDGSNWFESG